MGSELESDFTPDGELQRSSRYEDSTTLQKKADSLPSYFISRQLKLREERNEQINRVGINGFFQVLKIDRQQQHGGGATRTGAMKMVIVPPDAFNVADRINMAEMDLNLDNVRTIVSTVVSLRRPNHDSTLLSEKCLFSSNLADGTDGDYQRKMGDLRENFYS